MWRFFKNEDNSNFRLKRAVEIVDEMALRLWFFYFNLEWRLLPEIFVVFQIQQQRWNGNENKIPEDQKRVEFNRI